MFTAEDDLCAGVDARALGTRVCAGVVRPFFVEATAAFCDVLRAPRLCRALHSNALIGARTDQAMRAAPHNMHNRA